MPATRVTQLLVTQNSFVLFVGSDPTPEDSFFELLSKGTVVPANTNGPITTSLLEVQRWMTRVVLQQLEVFSRELLDFGRQRVEECPEIRACEVLQISRLLPER